MLNQCSEGDEGLVPSAKMRKSSCFPALVVMAARSFSPMPAGHWAGSSRMAATIPGLPCARRASAAMTLSREPEGVVMRKRLLLSSTLQLVLAQRLGPAQEPEHLFAYRVTGLAEAGREHHDLPPRLRQRAGEKKRRDGCDHA